MALSQKTDSLASQRWPSVGAALNVVSSIAMIIASITVVWMAVGLRGAVPGTTQRSGDVEAIDGTTPTRELFRDGHVRGSNDAKVVMAEFTDFQCPFCGLFAKDTYPAIERELIKQGRLQYVFMNLPIDQIHPLASMAAATVECAASPSAFADLRDWLFLNQKTFSRATLLTRAGELNSDKTELAKCIEHDDTISRLSRQKALATQFEVQSTPTFLLGTVQEDGTTRFRLRVRGSQTYQAFQTHIQRVRDDLKSN